MALAKITKHTQKKPRMRWRTDRAWFGCIYGIPWPLLTYLLIRPRNKSDLFCQLGARTAPLQSLRVPYHGKQALFNQTKLHYAVCVPSLTFRLLLSELAILCAVKRKKRLHGLMAATEHVANHHFPPPHTTKIKQHRVRLSPEIHKCSSKSRSEILTIRYLLILEALLSGSVA